MACCRCFSFVGLLMLQALPQMQSRAPSLGSCSSGRHGEASASGQDPMCSHTEPNSRQLLQSVASLSQGHAEELPVIQGASPASLMGIGERQQTNLSVASLLRHSSLLSEGLARAAASLPLESTTRKLLQSFRVCGYCKNFQRLGESMDGGYLTCMDHLQDGHVRAAYSFGVEHHDKWSEDVVANLQVPVNQYDCTVNEAPEGCSSCTFFQKCIRSADGSQDSFPGQSWSLQEALAASSMAAAPDRSLLMKMDIEGSEWPILVGERSGANLKKFQEIIIEFHWLKETTRHEQYLGAMQSLLEAGFRVVHIHGNNFSGNFEIGGFQIPDVIEVTFEANAEPRMCVNDQEYLPQDHVNNPGADELPMAKLPY